MDIDTETWRHRNIERELFNSSWENPHLVHNKILGPEILPRIGCFAPWGRGAQPAGPCGRTHGHTGTRKHGHTDGLPYLCRSSDRYSYTGATLFRQYMLIQKNKLNTSGRFTQDDTDVMLNCKYIHVRGAGSPLGPHDSPHTNQRSSILFLLSSVFFPLSCFIISVFQRNFIQYRWTQVISIL